MADIPNVVATAVKVKSKHERWYLDVKECPYCGREHRHGAGAVVQGYDSPMDSMYSVRPAMCDTDEYYQLVKAQ
jgi:hypothetical protein